jgi:protein-disulfide isomerase
MSSRSRTPNTRGRGSAQRIAAEQARQAARRRMLLVGGAIAAAVVLAVVLIVLNLPGDEGDHPDVVAVTDPHPGVQADGRTLGDPNAPVTVVEYGDYQCPGCGQFARDLEPRLVEEYVAAGLVRFEFRDFAFLDQRADGSESQDSAAATFCAADQGAFWPYHATLYSNQHGENEGAFTRDRLREMAAALGLNTGQFDSCLADGTHTADVEASNQSADELGLGGTPSFVVNGQVIDYTGYDSLAAAIDAALATAGVAR